MRVNQIRPGDSKRNGRDQVPPPPELHSDCSSTSRTRVTIFSGGEGYRFFVCFRLKLCLHEFFLIQTTSPARHVGVAGTDSGGCRDDLFRMGRYLGAREGMQAWLLLWLCDVQDHSGLLEDVRAAEICFAVVGGNVRQAADEFSGGEPGRRTAPAETPACGACSKLVPFQLFRPNDGPSI
jgi:hypothetical protein